MESDRTFGDLVTALRGQIDDPPESFEQDVSTFLEGLRDRDLVELEG
jgi:hypothetical protein